MSFSQPRIVPLDGLRGLAILLVLVWHYVIGKLPEDQVALKRLGSLTWSGVDLFFVLSGFLLGGILLSHRRTNQVLKTFYMRRFYRIVPLYAAWLALFFALRAWMVNTLTPEAYTWLFRGDLPAWSYLTLTQNFPMALHGFGTNWLGATWSLAVEAQFCLLLPLLIYACPPRRLPQVLIGLIVLAPILRFIALGVLHLPLGDYVLLPCRIDALLLGVLCAYALQQPKAREWLRQHRQALYGLLGMFALGSVVLMWTGVDSPLASAVGYLWIAGGYSCLLLIVVTDGFRRLFTNRLLRELGTIAYGVYLFHQGINGLLHGLILGRPPTLADAPGAAITLIALIVTLLLAHGSWRFFERRFVEMGHKYMYRSPAETSVVQPAS